MVNDPITSQSQWKDSPLSKFNLGSSVMAWLKSVNNKRVFFTSLACYLRVVTHKKI